MIVIAATVTGAFMGGHTARKRGGNMLDMGQYAAGCGLAFVILGLFVTRLIDRTLSA